jgi:AcrR family transcriptional regulator
MVKNGEKEAGTEEKILAAAKKVFVQKGMAGARMQDIADEAGINKALLHYYFRSKEQLFETIFSEIAHRFIPKVKAILSAESDFYDKISLFCEEYIGLVMDNPYMPMFVMNEMHKQPTAFIQKIFSGQLPDLSKFIGQLQEEIVTGRIKPIQPAHLVMNMMAMCIFPFIGKPILGAVIGISDEQFMAAMEERKKLVPQFIFDSIRK